MASPTNIIFDTIATVVKNDPNGSERDHLESFRFEVANSQKLRDAVINLAFEGKYHLIRERIKIVPNATTTTKPKPRPMKSGGGRASAPIQPFIPRKTAEVTDLITELRKTVLMDTVLPGGKLLRDATFGECRTLEGWLGDIGRAGKANEIVGKKLTERDLHNLLGRQKQKKAA